MKLGLRAQAMITEFAAKSASQAPFAAYDPLNISSAFMELPSTILANPNKLAETQLGLWQDYLRLRLWQTTSMKTLSEASEDIIEADKGDKRFKSDAWRDNQIFNFIKQGYLLTSKHVQNHVASVDGLSGQ